MALMLDILALKRPEEWTICNYTCKTYEIFNVPEGTKEYDDIVQEFRNKIGSNYKITELKRIQHPYLYGIYLINRERCIRFGTPSMEARTIKGTVEHVDLETLIRTNFDARHGACYSGNTYVVQKELLHGRCSYPEYLITATATNVSSQLSFSSFRL